MMEHREDDEQHALMQWAQLQPLRGADICPHASIADYLFAVPNGGKRFYIEAARMRGLGVKKGVSDLQLPVARLGYHTLFIEMKKPIAQFRSLSAAFDAQTDAQRIWQDKMQLCGNAAVTCYGWDEARELLMFYVDEHEAQFETHYGRLVSRFDDCDSKSHETDL